MIDEQGYRANVGIIIANDIGRLFWARRIGMDAWQFPQGGIKEDESVEDAMYRELEEEVGLMPEDVEIIGCTESWLRYELPKRFVRHYSKPLCIGQKQIWYLLKLVTQEHRVRFDQSETPEFDEWRWVDYWYPAKNVVPFKRDVYEQALEQLKPLFGLFDQN